MQDGNKLINNKSMCIDCEQGTGKPESEFKTTNGKIIV